MRIFGSDGCGLQDRLTRAIARLSCKRAASRLSGGAIVTAYGHRIVAAAGCVWFKTFAVFPMSGSVPLLAGRNPSLQSEDRRSPSPLPHPPLDSKGKTW